MKKSKIALLVVAFLIVLAVVGAVVGEKDLPAPVSADSPAASSGSVPSVSAETPSPAASGIQSGMFIDFGDYTIEITDVKIIPAENNSFEKAPTIAFWYTTTNISQDDLSPAVAWILSMEAYQDNNPNYLKDLEVASLPDQAHLHTQDAKIKKGGSLENSVAYVLDDLETPVLLKSSEFSPIDYAQEFPVK